MFLSSIERENKLYELKDYDLANLQVEENVGKVIVVGKESFEVAEMPKEVKGVAEIDGVVYATLMDAFNAVESIGEVKLIDDIKLNEFTTLPIDVEITLNLNNHSIFASETAQINGCLLAVPNGSTLIINGCGNIYASAPDGSNKVYGAIQVVSKDTYDPSKTAKLIINNGNISGYYYGIVGNGSRGNSEVIINGGHLFTTSPDGVVIYNPQPDSKVTINGGFIEGATCIEMRAGDLTVNGGFLTSLAAPTEVNANGSGPTTTGSAIAIAQHNTKLPINAVINSGIVKGYHALYQSNPQKNEEEAIALVNISVNDGTFIAINGGSIPVYSENKEKFVVGGTFVPAIEEKYMA